MSYGDKWKILDELLMELQKKGEKIPAEIMKDLRSAKTIIQVLKADPMHAESISRIETYLRNVESYVIFTAEKLGTDTVQQWLKKLKEPIKSEKDETKNEQPRFIAGVPRDKKWVRIQITEDTPVKEIQKLVKQNKLSYTTQENGHLVVYGNSDDLKSFVKSVAKQFRGIRNDKQGV